ncbi:MAG: hypothetical protein AAF402_00305 [Pseudomonadota bacterium]
MAPTKTESQKYKLFDVSRAVPPNDWRITQCTIFTEHLLLCDAERNYPLSKWTTWVLEVKQSKVSLYDSNIGLSDRWERRILNGRDL